jgi:hypothetical protein
MIGGNWFMQSFGFHLIASLSLHTQASEFDLAGNKTVPNAIGGRL